MDEPSDAGLGVRAHGGARSSKVGRGLTVVGRDAAAHTTASPPHSSPVSALAAPPASSRGGKARPVDAVRGAGPAMPRNEARHSAGVKRRAAGSLPAGGSIDKPSVATRGRAAVAEPTAQPPASSPTDATGQGKHGTAAERGSGPATGPPRASDSPLPETVPRDPAAASPTSDDGGGDSAGASAPPPTGAVTVATRTPEWESEAAKPSLALMQSSVCKVGDNSPVIGPPNTRSELFQTRGADTSVGLQYFFSGNGLAPLFAVIRAPAAGPIEFGPQPHVTIRLFTIPDGTKQKPELAANVISITAVSQPNSNTVIVKLNLINKNKRATTGRRLFYLDIGMACANCKLRLVSSLFKVATKPSRVVLSGVPADWTAATLQTRFPQLGARDEGVDRKPVPVDDLLEYQRQRELENGVVRGAAPGSAGAAAAGAGAAAAEGAAATAASEDGSEGEGGEGEPGATPTATAGAAGAGAKPKKRALRITAPTGRDAGARGQPQGDASPRDSEASAALTPSSTPSSDAGSGTATMTQILDAIIRDFGTARGVFLLNFKTSTRCVQFFTANYPQLCTYGIKAFLAPKRHVRVGRELRHHPQAALTYRDRATAPTPAADGAMPTAEVVHHEAGVPRYPALGTNLHAGGGVSGSRGRSRARGRGKDASGRASKRRRRGRGGSNSGREDAAAGAYAAAAAAAGGMAGGHVGRGGVTMHGHMGNPFAFAPQQAGGFAGGVGGAGAGMQQGGFWPMAFLAHNQQLMLAMLAHSQSGAAGAAGASAPMASAADTLAASAPMSSMAPPLGSPVSGGVGGRGGSYAGLADGAGGDFTSAPPFGGHAMYANASLPMYAAFGGYGGPYAGAMGVPMNYPGGSMAYGAAGGAPYAHTQPGLGGAPPTQAYAAIPHGHQGVPATVGFAASEGTGAFSGGGLNGAVAAQPDAAVSDGMAPPHSSGGMNGSGAGLNFGGPRGGPHG